MTNGLSILFNEHHRLGAILACLGDIAEAGTGQFGNSERKTVVALLHYLDDFVYRHHHPKEDNFLFPAVAKCCPEAAEDIATLEAQHAKGTEHLHRLQNLLRSVKPGDSRSSEPLLRELQQYVDHERQHMAFENTQIFTRAQQLLQPQEWEPIDRAFNDHQDPLFGDAANAQLRQRFLDILSRAPAPYGLSDRQAGTGTEKEAQNRQGPWSCLRQLLGL